MKKIDWLSFGANVVAGVDEVGRGCLAGPVFAAAAVLPPGCRIPKLTDSKLMTPEDRDLFAEKIKKTAMSWAVGMSSVEEIEEFNILRASHLAMRRALEGLNVLPELVLVDGHMPIGGPWKQIPIVKGDLLCLPISAASVLAKTARDKYMEELDAKYPGYQFASHKGYGTPEHRKAILEIGVCAIHRKEFAGVREFLPLPLEQAAMAAQEGLSAEYFSDEFTET